MRRVISFSVEKGAKKEAAEPAIASPAASLHLPTVKGGHLALFHTPQSRIVAAGAAAEVDRPRSLKRRGSPAKGRIALVHLGNDLVRCRRADTPLPEGCPF